MISPEVNNTILYLGPKWWGSDARALGAALRRLGHTLIEVDYEDYFPLQWSGLPLQLIRRLMRRLCAADYNRAVRRYADNQAIDFVMVFKGALLEPGTLAALKDGGVAAYCFYPDVSFMDHGRNIWACLPLYECVFTTKFFHLSDTIIRQHVRELQLVSHGYDPEVHRPVSLNGQTKKQYACDACFVGCWSPKKEDFLAALCRAIPGIDLRVWGPGWSRAQPLVRERWQGRGAYGDELAVIYGATRVNIALLSEAGGGTACGDQTTARTWQIPACGAFMLHERTDELRRYFSEDQEVVCFSSCAEMASKVAFYLEHEAARGKIAEGGYRRCMESGYNYAPAATAIIEYHRALSAKGLIPITGYPQRRGHYPEIDKPRV